MDNASAEVNEIVDGGWDGVIRYIQQLIQCQLYLLDDIRTNRPYSVASVGTVLLTQVLVV